MFSYTKATLKAALQAFNDSSNNEFVDALDQLIQLGELRALKRLDLDALDSTEIAETVADSAEVEKPDNLVVDRLLVLQGDGKTMIIRRSRAWVEMYNTDGETGSPRYYCDLDEDRWLVAPVAADDVEIVVHGIYRPVSIIDGGDDDTTWLSTRVPELLYTACSIEACEFLKFWSKKSAQEADFEEQAARFLKTAGSLQRSDVEDLLGNRMNTNKPDTQAE